MSAQALQGIRIVDLSMGWAGPLCARQMADLGADVIKVESCERFDWWRSWEATPEWIEDDGAEKSAAFNMVNRNKRAITLDLEDETGRDLLLQLVSTAHAVVENYSGGVLPKLRLTYDHLRAAQPNIILLSMPPFGSTGPWAEFRAYGSTVEQSSGLPHLNGLDADPPTMHHVAYGDPMGGLNGGAALLTALYHQTSSGEGQFVDLSQVESLFSLAAHGIMTYSATGQAPARTGNVHATSAPHGVYRCAGEEQWLLLQIFDETQWDALCSQAPVLTKFGASTDRLARRDELDAALNTWCANQDAFELMERLQGQGIPAVATHNTISLLSDRHLEYRGYWQWLDRAVVGRQPNPSTPYRFGAQPIAIQSPAPTLGQHNDEVLSDVLGLDEQAIERLRSNGIIGEKPRMPGTRPPRSASS
ncbi:MAG: CoA transferase [Pseudomonadota bacterium]